MKYMGTDKVIQVGDNVMYAGVPGVIVFVIEDDSFSDRYPKVWSYLGKGLGVELQKGDWQGTLFHLDCPDEDLEPATDACREEKGAG